MRTAWIFLAFLGISWASIPIVINTWKFELATRRAWEALTMGSARGIIDNALGALEEGCRQCQDLQCDHTVGYGGSPDEHGETTLDALIFDGLRMDMGAVGALRKIKDAIGVARKVLEHTDHSFLAGELASEFATAFGFSEETLTTNYSVTQYDEWKNNSCQPNYWKGVTPDPKTSCGPYTTVENQPVPKGAPWETNEVPKSSAKIINHKNHDTIGMVVISQTGHIVAGTSTNGLNHKIPGRVGDSPIPGAGAYADNDVGGAAATGDGDVMMRFLPSFVAVEQMRLGASPVKAAREAVSRIVAKYPEFMGAVIAVDTKGNYGAACNGIDVFPFSLANVENPKTVVKYVNCSTSISAKYKKH